MSKIQVRRGASTLWTSKNPVLGAGELGFATEGILKIGDGVQSWNALSSIGGGAGGGIAAAAGTQTATSGTVVFAHSNGITWGMSGSSQITASHNGLTTAAQSDHSHGNPTLALTNLTGTTASASNGFTLSLSAAAPGAGGGFAAQGSGAYTQNTGTIQFANSNRVTFGLSTNQMTASIDAASTDHSHGNPTLALTNLTGTTASASNGFTLSLSAAAPGGGAGATVSEFCPPWAWSGRATNSSLGQNTIYFQPFDLPCYVAASRINFYISISGALSAGNSTGTCYQRISYALYTLNATSAGTATLNLLTSYGLTHLSHSMTSNTQYAATHYIGLSNATSHSTKQTALSTSNATTYLASMLNGPRVIALPVNSTLSPGPYWLALAVSTISGNAMTNGLSVQITSVGLQPDVRPIGQASAATNASVFRAIQGWGSYSATSNAFPATVALTTDNIRAAVNQTLIHFDLIGYSTSTNVI